MHSMEVHDPSGGVEITQLFAGRLDGIEGKTIGLLSDDMWQAHRMLPLLQKQIEARYPSVKVIPHTEFPQGTRQIDREETADLIERSGVDAVIVGNAA